MKLRIEIIVIFLLLSVFGSDLKASAVFDYGLHFKSHSSPGVERTSLLLNDNQPITVKNDFTVSFRMWIRGNEPDFGSILHLRTNTGQFIRFSFVSDDNKHFPALVSNESIVPINTPIEREKWLDVALHLNLKENLVEVDYDDRKVAGLFPMQGVKDVTVFFGMMNEYLADVPPVNIRDVKIIQDGTTTYEWKLWRHNGDICYDELQGAVARAVHPFWLIDNHIEWKPVYNDKVKGSLDVAFNAREALFYLVTRQTIEILDEEGTSKGRFDVKGGHPAMEYPNHLLYDTLSNHLVSYSLSRGEVSRFSFASGTWDNKEPIADEPRYYNHARTFNPADSSFYFFGGYGFYQYRNELFRMKSGADRVERIEYERPFYPRYSAAMAVVGDELYIFGGRGNKYGKQELTSDYYFGLCVLDLKTRHSRLAWKRNRISESTIMAASMYFEPSDSSFYAASMYKGGTLWKISMKDSTFTEVSKSIQNDTNYQDLDFNLYASPSHNKLFLVMDKILSDHSHNLSIYSINMPLVEEVDIRQTLVEEGMAGSRWYIYAAAILLMILGGVWLFRRSGRKNERRKMPAVSAEDTRETAAEKEPSAQEVERGPVAELPIPASNYYDRSRASISLLGSFNVRDKEGNDITSSFTPRLKHLLILLILYTEKTSQGIPASKTTEILWPEKEENSARNNRNVNLRKLRVLLESIGGVEVVTENNFLRIRLGEDVFCDYHAVLACIRQFSQQESDELLNRILELLLFGPLLPNTTLDWLDDFKDAYSSQSIDLLRNLLELEVRRGQQDMVIRLSDIMFLHDPLNEEALAAKCAVLSAQGKKGIARNVYDRFCKEYRESMGEDYQVAFADL